MVNIGNSWDKLLADQFESEYYKNLRQFLKYEYSHYTIYPHMNDIFNALRMTDYDSVRVVLLGQDPYHGPGQAHGMCFSVNRGVAIPPSLRNIYQEIKNDLGIEPPKHGNLLHWADQGVLLLNTVLTVRAHKANSHAKQGWETFTDAVIEEINSKKSNVVFLLWGNPAQVDVKEGIEG